MKRAESLFRALTAGDVMSRAVVVLPRGMSVAGAARLLSERQLSVAPVIDAPGRCVGVLAATDLLRWAADGDRAGEEGPAPTECVWLRLAGRGREVNAARRGAPVHDARPAAGHGGHAPRGDRRCPSRSPPPSGRRGR
jgi:hypothetical protein